MESIFKPVRATLLFSKVFQSFSYSISGLADEFLRLRVDIPNSIDNILSTKNFRKRLENWMQ